MSQEPLIPHKPEPEDHTHAATAVENTTTLFFGRYRRLRELGRGGMGVVLLVQDEVLGVPVALKLVPEQVLEDTEGSNELKKEVLRGLALTHPGLVRVFSFERDEHMAAIVMEYVEGETLATLKMQQSGGCFDCRQIQPWLEQLCAVLDYAHREAKIAHRDLKPRNIILTREGRIKVADFGIASSLTDTMSRVSVRMDSSGTPPYMSPQQAMGNRPTHLDDLYSLGATLYDLLTGKPPFFRGNVLAQVLNEVAPTLSERRIQLEISGKEAIPESWERVIAACLSKNPEERPRSGAAILEILNGLSGEPARLAGTTSRLISPSTDTSPHGPPVSTWQTERSATTRVSDPVRPPAKPPQRQPADPQKRDPSLDYQFKPERIALPYERPKAPKRAPATRWGLNLALVLGAAALTAAANVAFLHPRTAKPASDNPAAVSASPPAAVPSPALQVASVPRPPAAPSPTPKKIQSSSTLDRADPLHPSHGLDASDLKTRRNK